jgi:hypothetical protein
MTHARTFILSLALAAATLTTGCTMIAPRYSPSLENVQKLKDADLQSSQVGKFQSTPGRSNPVAISIRGSSLKSPYNGSYAEYLADAVTQELSMAGRLAPDSQVQITGTLQKNDINAAGVSTASGDIEARFVVTRAGAVTYDKVTTVHDEWDSSFVGGIAIPRAQQRYPVIVQKLLGALYADSAFLQALK